MVYHDVCAMNFVHDMFYVCFGVTHGGDVVLLPTNIPNY